MSTDLSEEELARDLRDGSADALTALFDRHADRVYNHCFRWTGDWAEAEDAVATVFLEVWRHRHRVVVLDGSALPWVYGVATNVCRNLTRGRRRRLLATQALPAAEHVADHADRVTERIASQDRMRAVLSALEDLPTGEREVLSLVAWAGLSYEQTAVALGIPVGTVRSRLSRARTRLSARVDAGSEGDQP